MSRLKNQPGFTALLTGIPVSEGGNSAPFVAGYRAHLAFVNCEDQNTYGVEVVQIDGDKVQAGKTANCEVRFLNSAELLREHLHLEVGMMFALMDGKTSRATGQILDLLCDQPRQ